MKKTENNILDVRKLFILPASRILKLRSNIKIRFEDNKIIDCYFKDIILFRYMFNFVNDLDKKLDLISDYFPGLYLRKDSNTTFKKSTYLDIYSLVFKNYVKKHKANRLDIEKLFKGMYESIDLINREFVRNIVNYAISIDLEDLMEIQFERELIEALIASAKHPSKYSIENTYSVIKNVITKDKFANNHLALIYRFKAASIDQINQLLGSRGYLTELSSRIFEKPMTNSFFLGCKNMYDVAIESRAAAKALYLSTTAIRQSEYTNRELQLITMVIENVYRGDCGSPTYTDWYVKPPEKDSKGNIIYSGDLPHLVGKRYLDEDGVERTITADDQHLIGKFIKIRLGIYCSLRDKKTICSACIGELADSIFDHQNLGNTASNKAMVKASQSILSTKHLLTTANVNEIKLNKKASLYFNIKGQTKLYLKPTLFNKMTQKLYIKFRQTEVWGLPNITKVKNILSINLSKLSRIRGIVLIRETKNNVEEIEIETKVGNRATFLSLPFISYIMQYGFSVPDEDSYLIDITNYDYKKPILVYEKKEFDYAALSNSIKQLLKTRKYRIINGVKRSEFMPHILLQKLFELYSMKFPINLAVLDIIIYAFTVYDLDKDNYDLGRNPERRDVAGFKQVIDGRSIGASYDWDGLMGKILNPISYKEKDKPSHSLDVLFKPNEVIENDGWK